MRELPKIARDRLSATPVQNAHLDANLITAFVERALLPDERQRVTAHLAVCEACRAEVQLVIRATQVGTGAAECLRPALVEPRSWWRRGQGLCPWRTVSAVTAVAAIAFAFRIALPQPNSPGMRSAAPTPSSAPVTVASKIAPPPARAPSAPGSSRSAKSASQREVGENAGD